MIRTNPVLERNLVFFTTREADSNVSLLCVVYSTFGIPAMSSELRQKQSAYLSEPSQCCLECISFSKKKKKEEEDEEDVLDSNCPKPSIPDPLPSKIPQGLQKIHPSL